MAKQIYNGGIQAGILRAAKDSGAILGKEDEERLKLLESLPKNQWIDLDDSDNPISKDEAKKNWNDHLSKFKPIK
ncbi:hypothetical protein [Tenacibaculum sp. C7A-26P2]|uniref:hypothetical protein n=1 Tax=Tenacibaculum sp. C7A-26P2 TaxID=3447504 RepID=UPI003F83ED09